MKTDSTALTPAKGPTRRMLLCSAASLAALGLTRGAWAEDAAILAGAPFSYEGLIERMRKAATEPYVPPAPLEGPLAELDYDDYRKIQFDPDRARWAGPEARAVLHAYHPGWLFNYVVRLNEVVDGQARPMLFERDDYIYHGDSGDHFPADAVLPGVSGFRLNAPLNDPERFDEVVSFLGASYFRALGKGNVYGLSARGLAVNTAIGREEEFPLFSEFWIERPDPGSDHVVFYAALESPSVAGAFRFAVTPGETTTIDVDQHLFFREAVAQLGVAPLTSMFLFAPNDRSDFNDYRHRVHDSEALVVRMEGQELFRPLRNPETLGNSYIGVSNPTAFGLVQRHRAFDDYLDAEARYERRPSLMVEPLGDWGSGSIRLIEIPTELESNDNIVAFWVPEEEVAGGDARSFAYRLHWGAAPLEPETKPARILRTLAGYGGAAGVDPLADRQKFVIDFDGSDIGEPEEDRPVSAEISAVNGVIAEDVLEFLDEHRIWRLVLEVEADAGAVAEIKAHLAQDDRRLSETWLYQWTKI
ncbi:glucan biosynthesis protein [Palleronia sp.]|uniref:glucan biosynthesis protein n=1 Tax=Palleronia sp. TaxID=1940284 RepID=UPI0035C879B1